jgi:hypothetical protein
MRTTSWQMAAAAALSAGLAACGDTGSAGGTGCDNVPCALDHDFGAQTVAAGEERDSFCQSWTLDNPTELWVRKVAMSNDGAYHHSNWFFVPNDVYNVPDGARPCSALGFDELTAAVAGGVLFAQSTQAQSEAQVFPDGVAVRIPPYSRVIASTHLLNITDGPLTTDLRVHIDTIPTKSVAHKLVPFRLTYHDLHIPPNADSGFEMSCDIATAYQNAMGKPIDMDLWYVLPHAHVLADQFELKVIGGARDGEVVYTHDQFTPGESWGETFAQPLHFGGADGATGLHYQCGFHNPRAVEVGWGIGDQEMCVMLGFAETDAAFEAYVDDGTGAAEAPVGGRDMFTGPCAFLVVPFDQTKGGGTP